MSERSFEVIVREFAKKWLAGFMETQVGQTRVENVPMSLRLARSPRNQVVIGEKHKKRPKKRPTKGVELSNFLRNRRKKEK